jgi:hypothetical protein
LLQFKFKFFIIMIIFLRIKQCYVFNSNVFYINFTTNINYLTFSITFSDIIKLAKMLELIKPDDTKINGAICML